MPLNKKVILSYIQSQADRPLKLKELGHELHIPPEDYSMFRRAVRQLIQTGELVRLKRGRIGVPDQLGVVVG